MSQNRQSKVPLHAKQAIKKLREFYDLGKTAPRETEYGGGEVASAAKKLGINADTLRKCRAFADPDRGYTPQELDELFGQLEAHNYGDGTWAFSTTHMIRLISIPKAGSARRQLQDLVVEEELSCAQLDDEIRKRYPPRRKGGRRRHVPEERSALLRQVALECDRWERWLRSLSRVKAGKSSMELLPKETQMQLKRTTKLIQKLRKSVEDAQ